MIYNTGIKDEGNYCEILDGVLGQMSDGIWENTKAMEKYWKSLRYGVNEQGYIYLEDRNRVTEDVADFFANKIKQVVKIDNDDNGGLEWKRDNPRLTNYIRYGKQITVGECYKLYDLLKGRDVTNKRYSIVKKFNVEVNILGNRFNMDVEAISKYAADGAARKMLSEIANIRIL